VASCLDATPRSLLRIGGRGSMGIVLRQDNPGWDIIDAYYTQAKREPTLRGDLEVTATFTFGHSFGDLLKALVDRQASHVVIATHGNTNGLVMPLTSSTK